MQLTGMRVGEVVTMRTGDLDMTGKVWDYRPPTHKMAYKGRERIIPLHIAGHHKDARLQASSRRRSEPAERDYLSNRETTCCGAALACDKAASVDCCRTCALVRFAASKATSASRMRDSAAEKPEICDCARSMAN